MIIATFSDKDKKKIVDTEELKKKSGLDEKDWENLLQWSGQVSIISSLLPIL
jgi:hypothetical protein